MTPAELRDIDRKVAQAIGWKYHEDLEHYEDREMNYLPVEQWNPSTDWNDAMFAAEKAGLFDKGLFINHAGPEYSIVEQKNLEFWSVAVENLGVHYMAETPHLAICNAILHLKADS